MPAVMASMSWVDAFIPLCCLAGFAFSLFLFVAVKKVRVGPAAKAANGAANGKPLLAAEVAGDDGVRRKAQEIQEAIQEGADSFLYAEYFYMFGFMLLFSVLLLALLGSGNGKGSTPYGKEAMTNAIFTTVAFILGAVTSTVAGFIGMKIATYANARTALEARGGVDKAFVCAFQSGAIMGLMLTSVGLLVLYAAIRLFGLKYGAGWVGLYEAIAGYGLGGSAMALFGRVGGGIYTKAADVGADLVGKIEQNIPEDDPRNPAVIADLVGDNVGDCAARGADLFESIAAEIISAMILGGTMAKQSNLSNPIGFIMFPLVVHSLDLVVSAVGIMSVKGQASKTMSSYDIMKRGYSVSIFLAAIGFVITCRTLLYTETAPNAWMYFTACGFVGISCSYCFVFISQYYTDYKYAPVRKIADASATGHGTNIIAGVGVGMEATAMPVIVISIAVTAAYWFGKMSGLEDANGNPTGGLFGTAVACMGMLSTAAYVLTMDIFGPIADNAGGIVEMSDEPESVREITDELDAVGNTTKATTKGYAIGSAALAAFLLFSAYMDEVSAFNGEKFDTVDIAIPEVWIGGVLGSMLVYLFSAWACAAVGNSAQDVVIEVRRQFEEKPGIMTYEEMPDYARCVSIVAASALKEMKKPGLLAVGAPIAVGVTFRFFGALTGQKMLGAKVVASMIMFATVSGILMALFLNTAGGAWDNAKKYVELGAHGGKGSEAHKASITGDTVGDPFKDTAGPSIHVLIKMLATITLVMAPLFLD